MPNSTQYENDGDVIMTPAHQLVFEFLHAPKLEGWGQDALVTWKKQREQYEECIRQRCVESGERPEVAMRPIKLAFEPKLLEALCLYELQKPVDDVMDSELRALINQRVQSVKNAQVPDLDALFKKHLNVDMHEDDIDARVLKYFRDFSDLVEKNGLGDILGVGDPLKPAYNERMKLRCNFLVDNLEPAILRDEVRRHTKFVDQEAKRNDFVLFRVIKEKALAKHKYHVLTRGQKGKLNSDKRDKATTGSDKSQSNGGKKWPRPTGTGGARSSGPSKTTETKSKPPRTGCWHYKGDHWLRDCPTATEADKAVAVERMKALRNGSKAKKVTPALAVVRGSPWKS
uniref:Uncharacterized protein n=1 Tax=Phytophthora ramorum TaxID=164328 RepID=H3GKF2_PHYRM